MITVVERVTARTVVKSPGPQGEPGPTGPAGPSVADGDKGDIIVSGGGVSWAIDSALLTAFMRTITAAANAATARDLLGLEIGTDIQGYSSVLAATTASFLTAHETKLGHISITQAVDLDAIETRVNALDAAVVLKGAWDASAGSFPGGGTAQAGESWIVSVAGTVGGVAFALNDRIIAIADNASTTTFALNWFKADYTDQVLSVAGKTGAVTLQVADITDMSANGRSLVSAANYAAMQALLGIDLKAPLASPTFSGLVTTAGQVAFPAAQNPSANANTLDDYEEGSTTPTVVSGSGAFTTVSCALSYTKVGDLVTWRALVTITDAGTAASTLEIPMPFTAANPAPLIGYESQATGVSVGGRVNGATAFVQRYDGATIIATGRTVTVGGSFKV